MKINCLFILLLLCSLATYSETVTGLAASFKNGQVFLTWNNTSNSTAFYKVYRSPFPITSAIQIASCEYLGKTDSKSSKNYNLSTHDGFDEYVRVDSGAAPLTSAIGLFVATTIVNGNYYYAVVTQVITDDATIIAGQNSLINAISESVMSPCPVYQESRMILSQTYDIYCIFTSSKNSITQALENDCGFFCSGIALYRHTAPGLHPLKVRFHPGGQDYISAVTVTDQDEIIISLEDNIQGDQNTNWWGVNQSFDFYNQIVNAPTSGINYNFTAKRVNTTVEWAMKHLPVDTNRIYLDGTSFGSIAAILYSLYYPEHVTASKITVPIFNFAFQSDYNPLCSMNTGRKNRNVGNLKLGSVTSNLMTNLGYRTYDLLNAGWAIHHFNDKNYPVIYCVNGKHDEMMGWSEKPAYYDSVNANHVGGYYFWDNRDHGGNGKTWGENFDLMRYRKNLSYPAFAHCSLNEDYGTGNGAVGPQFGSVNGSLDWNNNVTEDPQNWQAKIFIRNLMKYTGELVIYPDSCTADVTPRRVQQFHVPDGAYVTWTVTHNNNIIQSGNNVYHGGVIVIPAVKVFKDTSVIHLSYVSPLTCYRDSDADGYGNPIDSISAISAPAGYALNNKDCNDLNGTVHPNAIETCNSIDDNCDGQVDEGVKTLFFADTDNDGYGDPSHSTEACGIPLAYSVNNTDCNDQNISVNPAAAEVNNQIDDNCNGFIDEGLQMFTFYRDADGDSFGDPMSFILSDTSVSGFVTDLTDCNDSDAAINPNTTETCNGVDDNCNAQTDEGVTNIYYADADGDSYGDITIPIQSCSQPVGFVNNSSDCNDNNIKVYPSRQEVCNAMDDNCDSQIDEGVTITFYADADQDSYGDANITMNSCNPSSGFVGNNLDCNDANTNMYPGASEVCNGFDDNCNSQVDEGVTNAYYVDSDNDGYGNTSIMVQACNPPSGFAVNANDCSDQNMMIHPGVIDICNGIDDNCNGAVDENAVTATATAAGDLTFCEPGMVILNVAATGNGLSYQWKSGNDMISGATASSYISTNTGDFSAIVSNGICSSSSNTLSVVKNSLPPTSISPTGIVNECSGLKVTFTAANGFGYKYQWYKNNKAVSGKTSSTYVSGANENGNYKVTVTSDKGCIASSPTSTLNHVEAPLAIITPLGDLNICTTKKIILQASSDSEYSYAWLKGSKIINGATNVTYQAITSGNYKVTVTNNTGCKKTSAPVTVKASCKESSPEQVSNEPSINVYPNPSAGNLMLDINNDDIKIETEIEVYNLLGQNVYHEKFSANQAFPIKMILPDHCKSGLYFMQIKMDGNIFSRMLTIAK